MFKLKIPGRRQEASIYIGQAHFYDKKKVDSVS